MPRELGRLLVRLLTVREVAEVLQVSTSTVYRLCLQGELRHVRVSNAIRVLPREVEAFLRAREVER